MSPPSVIVFIIRPRFLSFIKKMKEISVRALRTDISTFFVFRLRFINSFSVHPLIERAAVIEYSVKDHPHAPCVHLLHQFCKQAVACLQIPNVPCPILIFCRSGIVLFSFWKNLSSVVCNHAVMRVDVVIILNIILVIRRGNKQWIEIDDFNSKLFQIVQFIQNSLQISSMKSADIHCRRKFIPVFDFTDRLSDINVFSILHIVRWVSITEAIYKNLIHYSAFCPCRCGKSGHDPEIVILHRMFRYATSMIAELFTLAFYPKIINKHRICKLHFCFIIIKHFPGGHLLHLQCFSS